ncbi:MAG: hypothetical protein AAFQ80_14295 [Cyanobacteria bacterium J06621_8]
MIQSWKELIISREELEQKFTPSMISHWAIALATGLILGESQALSTVCKLEGSCLFLSFIFNFPLVLILNRNSNLFSNNVQGLVITLAIALSLSALYLIIFNYYLWQRAKQLKLLSALLIKVRRYNQLVTSFQLLTEIHTLRSHPSSLDQKSLIELQRALNLTKNSLLKSIELENHLYFHNSSNTNIPHNPVQLLADLEDNLATIITPTAERDSEYHELLNEAIDLGVSLHQEVQKCWNLRQ